MIEDNTDSGSTDEEFIGEIKALMVTSSIDMIIQDEVLRVSRIRKRRKSWRKNFSVIPYITMTIVMGENIFQKNAC